LIGSDVAQRLRDANGAPVYILAGANLGALYTAAIDALGGTSHLVDTEAAFVAGIARIWSLIR
jgi:2-dehydro-3-deoxygalactonokinase